ncbi:MAG: hypothetical protein AAGF88_12695 [Pseudomonadota bacterium]
MIDQLRDTLDRSRRTLLADFVGVLALAAMTLGVLNLPILFGIY